MSSPEYPSPLVLVDKSLEAPCTIMTDSHLVLYWCAKCPGKNTPNEDALAIITLREDRAVLVVADGLGGQPAGDRAAELAASAIVSSVCDAAGDNRELREVILDGFEKANHDIMQLGVGAATTLAVVELDGDTVRPYHVGDSEVLVVGQRGKLKLQTISHSPVGHGVEAGLIEPEEAIHHQDRNVVSNMVGSPEMRIDIGPRVTLGMRDTLLVGSDGVFDNLSLGEIVECIRKGSLQKAADCLVRMMYLRMTTSDAGLPGKPDDSAFILLRLRET